MSNFADNLSNAEEEEEVSFGTINCVKIRRESITTFSIIVVTEDVMLQMDETSGFAFGKVM